MSARSIGIAFGLLALGACSAPEQEQVKAAPELPKERLEADVEVNRGRSGYSAFVNSVRSCVTGLPENEKIIETYKSNGMRYQNADSTTQFYSIPGGDVYGSVDTSGSSYMCQIGLNRANTPETAAIVDQILQSEFGQSIDEIERIYTDAGLRYWSIIRTDGARLRLGVVQYSVTRLFIGGTVAIALEQ